MDQQCLEYIDGISKLAQPLLEDGLYSSEEELLRELLVILVKRHIESEGQVILGFEKQFISWEKFNDAIMDIATPEQEDIFFEWESARDSVNAWQKFIDQLA